MGWKASSRGARMRLAAQAVYIEAGRERAHKLIPNRLLEMPAGTAAYDFYTLA